MEKGTFPFVCAMTISIFGPLRLDFGYRLAYFHHLLSDTMLCTCIVGKAGSLVHMNFQKFVLSGLCSLTKHK